LATHFLLPPPPSSSLSPRLSFPSPSSLT
jgi:hypothetical protein